METERRVYVATVGTNIVVEASPLDPGTIAERTSELTDPVSYGIYSEFTQKGRFPDRLYLLCTDTPPPGSKGIAESLRQKWRALIPDIVPHIIPAFDLDGAAAAVSEIARKEEGARIIVNYSSGTNPMQAGTLTRAVDHVLLGDVTQVVYVQEFRERRKEGKGTFDTMELKRVEPLRLYYARLFETASGLFQQFSYERAQAYFDQAEHIDMVENESAKRARGYRRLCEAYMLWDAFAYRRVPQELRGARNAFQGVELTLVEGLTAKLSYLEKQVLKYDKPFPSLFHVIDMLENSVRELVRGRKHECLMKVYRFYEMILEWRLAEAYGFFETKRAGNLTAAWSRIVNTWFVKKKLVSQQEAEKTLEKIRHGGEDFYGHDMELILGQLKDRTLARLQEGLRHLDLSMQQLRTIRNESPFYHGLETGKQAVKDKQLQGLVQLGYALLEDLVQVHAISAADLGTLQLLTRPFSYDPLTLLERKSRSR